ncbi:MAG: NUDIX domain-containing protein [Rhodospirillaceae bacterium]|nr:NUDIX domain-containing protein [Rhodospirillaceae bacterium]
MSDVFGGAPLRCRAVAAAIIAGRDDDARVLLLRRAGPVAGGAWGLVTGSIEPGETAGAAIRREIAEETGLLPAQLFTSGLTETFYFAPDNVVELMPIFVAILAEPTTVTLDHGSDDWRWCTRNEATALLTFAGQRRAIADIWHDFVNRAPEAFREVT